MPPPIPTYALDCKKKSKSSRLKETRSGMFFAELHVEEGLIFTSHDLMEFGHAVFGPLRSTMQEADDDLLSLMKSIESGGSMGLRRWISKYAPHGGTRSSPNPSVVPVLSKLPVVSLRLSESGDSIKVAGIRRPSIHVTVDPHVPVRIIERAIDLITDLLSSVVDSQLGILPPVEELLAVVKYAFSRDMSPCPIPESVISKYIIPLIECFLQTPLWACALSPLSNDSDDEQVIHGFLSQFLDRARQADIFGERKQIKRMNKKSRSKKLARHTVFVTNIPKTCSEKELFELFESGLGGDEKHVYKAVIMRDSHTNKSRGFGRVIFRNAKATNAALERSNWEFAGRLLYLESYAARAENEVVNEDESESDSHTEFPGLYDFLPSPKRPQRKYRLPVQVEETIRKLAAQHPEGCQLSLVADLVDPMRYGFPNLTEAVKSVEGLRVEISQGKKGAYIVTNSN